MCIVSTLKNHVTDVEHQIDEAIREVRYPHFLCLYFILSCVGSETEHLREEIRIVYKIQKKMFNCRVCVIPSTGRNGACSVTRRTDSAA